MVAGQTVDVTEEGTEPTPEKVAYIHLHKTADLLTAPVEAGAILAGAGMDIVDGCIRYGLNLGLAFQMVDDLLDVEGDAALMGKNTGMDAQHGKLTWIAAHGIEQTRLDARARIDEAVRAADIFDENVKFFKTLALDTLQRLQ